MEIEPFNVRNVLNRLVYDSYMGIMRISPNTLDDNDEYLEDDATVKLSSLEDSKKRTREVLLTDSDGNNLGIYFIPMAFPTMLYGDSSKSGLINITTKAKNVFVTNAMTVRSTLKVGKASESTARRSDLIVCTRGTNIDLHQWLLYPTESPNDNAYFNNKNRLNLFSPKLSESPYELVRKNLLMLPTEWYENPQPIIRDEHGNTIIGDDGYITYDKNDKNAAGFSMGDSFVNINNRIVLTRNINEEPVPVMHTRDYVLGNYDGHSFLLSNTSSGIHAADIKSDGVNWVGDITSDNININDSTNDLITKLSWLRIDNLIWLSIQEVLDGSVRYYDGSFRNVGYKIINTGEGEYDVLTVSLNGDGSTDKNLFFSSSVSDGKLDLSPAAKASAYGFLSENGLLLGQDVAPGLIMYNAMPIHRLFYHILRQQATNFFEERHYKGISGEGWRQVINNYVINKLVTGYTTFNESFTNNLTKNFLVCDGKTISYENYPSMNTNNRMMFKQIEGGLRAQRYTSEEIPGTWKGKPIEIAETSRKGIYYYLKETPNLLSLTEKNQRFIRGANWTVDSDMYKDINKTKSDADEIKFTKTPTQNMALYHHLYDDSSNFKLDSIKLEYPVDVQNKVYLYNYNVNPKNIHNHNTFISGGLVPQSSKIWMFPSIATSQKGGEVFMNTDLDNPEYDNDYKKVAASFSTNETPNTYCGISNKLVPVGMLWLDRVGFAKNGKNGAYIHFDLTSSNRYKIYIDNIDDNGGPAGTCIKYRDLLDSTGNISNQDRLWWLMKASEQEGSYSITEKGGYRCSFWNAYFTKCGKDRHLGVCHNHKLLWNYPLVVGGAGAYYMGAASNSEYERGISSLPYENVKYLGGSIEVNRPWNDRTQSKSGVYGMERHVHNSMTRWERYFLNKNVSYGGVEIEIDSMAPLIPSVSFVPLIRI